MLNEMLPPDTEVLPETAACMRHHLLDLLQSMYMLNILESRPDDLLALFH